MSLFISDVFAQPATAEAADQATSSSFSLIMIAAIFVLFYFMLIRPQNKRAKEHRELINQLQKGDEVTTAAGIIGKVTDLDEQFLKLKIAEGVEITMLRNAVSSVLPKGTVKTA